MSAGIRGRGRHDIRRSRIRFASGVAWRGFVLSGLAALLRRSIAYANERKRSSENYRDALRAETVLQREKI